MNIVYVGDADFERKVAKLNVSELERAIQQLETHLVNYKEANASAKPEQLEGYVQPYIRRLQARVEHVKHVLRSRS
jgi:hypothetical protein